MKENEVVIDIYEQLAYMIMFNLAPSAGDEVSAEFLKNLTDEESATVEKYLIKLGYDEDDAAVALKDYVVLHAYSLLSSKSSKSTRSIRKSAKLESLRKFNLEEFQFNNGLNVSAGINSATPVIQVQGTEGGIRSSYTGDPNTPVNHGQVTIVTELEVDDEEYDTLEDALADSQSAYKEASDAASIPSESPDSIDIVNLTSSGYPDQDDDSLLTSPSNQFGPLPTKKKKDQFTIESMMRRTNSNKRHK